MQIDSIICTQQIEKGIFHSIFSFQSNYLVGPVLLI